MGKIITTEDGGATFDGETGDLPVASPVVLGKVAEGLPLEGYEPGAVVATFPPGDLEQIEIRTLEEIESDPFLGDA